MNAIFVAQAFHWFANRESLEQFSQVLAKNGTLFMIWTKQV